MKKRYFLIPLLVLLCFACVFALIACDDEDCRHRDADDNALCDQCGERYSDATDEEQGGGDQMTSHTHAYGAWSVTTAATCLDGEETRACSCGSKETRLVAATGEHCYEDGVCTKCGAKALYVRKGNYIYFGEYPQTLKADDVTITENTDSRGYYLGSDNAYYAKVTATPYSYYYTFSTGAKVTSETEYYFKVEPIRWRILSEGDGKALILCDSIIESKAYDGGSDHSNDYKESDIRAWLNAEFYNTAFDELQQALILTTTVDNTAASTGDDDNENACADTADKVFLLSYTEATNGAYGFSLDGGFYGDTARGMKTSDYSRATGAFVYTDGEPYGYGFWWLRSPYTSNASDARYVYYDGGIYYSNADCGETGVVPALQISL